MDRKLFMVSLGPGDIDLITIKALERLKQSDIICVPTKSSDNSFTKSMTKKILDKLFKKHNFTKPLEPVYTPMHFRKEDWQYQVDIIQHCFKTNKIVSFVTLGDASVYSTVYYLLDIIKQDDKLLYENCEVIEGITSFSNASARIKKPLCMGDSRFEVIPLLNKDVPSTKIYMRPKIGFDTSYLPNSNNFYTFENMNYDNENIISQKISKTTKYMTLLIDFAI